MMKNLFKYFKAILLILEILVSLGIVKGDEAKKVGEAREQMDTMNA